MGTTLSRLRCKDFRHFFLWSSRLNSRSVFQILVVEAISIPQCHEEYPKERNPNASCKGRKPPWKVLVQIGLSER